METMFGLGLMVGPLFGGLLYELGGFHAPFAVCGGGLILCAIVGAFVLKPCGEEDDDMEKDEDDANEEREKATYRRLLTLPSVVYACVTLCVTGVSVSWYMPSLEVS